MNIIIKNRELELFEHTQKQESWVSWAPRRLVSKFRENNVSEQQLGGGAREGEPKVPTRAKNIILTGMRGSGKTVLGELLAAKLGREFIDLDDYIERDLNQKIAELVEEHGWDNFRAEEKKAAAEISKKDNLVISTGGGTFLDPESAESLKKNGFVILLTADLKKLAERIEFDPNRPALTDHKDTLSELEHLWEERKDIYLKYADLTYDTSEDLDPTSKVDELIEMLPV